LNYKIEETLILKENVNGFLYEAKELLITLKHSFNLLEKKHENLKSDSKNLKFYQAPTEIQPEKVMKKGGFDQSNISGFAFNLDNKSFQTDQGNLHGGQQDINAMNSNNTFDAGINTSND